MRLAAIALADQERESLGREALGSEAVLAEAPAGRSRHCPISTKSSPTHRISCAGCWAGVAAQGDKAREDEARADGAWGEASAGVASRSSASPRSPYGWRAGFIACSRIRRAW